jgi:hypothetical protein
VGTAVFEELEAAIKKYWADVTGDARKELTAILAKVKQDEADIGVLVTDAKTEIEAAIVAAEPAVKTAVEEALASLVAELERIITADL